MSTKPTASQTKKTQDRASSPAQTRLIQVEVGLKARDQLHLRLEADENDQVVASRLTGVGCTELLKAMSLFRPLLKGSLAQLPVPEGVDHSAVMMRELILRAQGRWQLPYIEEELCHCRAVATKKVDDAIVAGCHSVDQIKRATSASTSCGTCRPDIENLLNYRLNVPKP